MRSEQIFGQKESSINGILLNPNSFTPVSSLNAMTNDFLDEHQIDKSKYTFTVNTSLYYSVDEDSHVDNLTASQTLITQVSTAKLDFIAGDLETMLSIAYSDFFIDLREVLSEEQFALYEPYMLYIDQAVLDVLNAEEAADVSSVNVPDCDKPEMMEQPVPILIDVTASEYLKDFYVHIDKSIVLGCIHNAPHKELTAAYIEFLMEKQPAAKEND